MQSIIIVGDKQQASSETSRIIEENKISRFDIKTIQTEKTAGIADAKALQKNIFLTPNSGDLKTVIFECFFGITNDAQNALLKILEEPPEDTIIIITVSSLDFVLPTIISRCKIINLTKSNALSDNEKDELLNFLAGLKKDRISNSLKFAQGYSKDKETALNFLENLITVIHNNLEDDKNYGKVLKKLQSSYTLIKTTNVNIRLTLENLFLNLNA